MKFDWSDLRRELGLWRGENKCLPFWWRDDDAVEPTQALQSLESMSDVLGVAVHLAIIPKLVTEDLAQTLNYQFVPVVHGWAHDSHASTGHKNAEFGQRRDRSVSHAELRVGLHRMRHLFGDRLSMMFVPPWNRIDEAFTPFLRELGYTAVSTFRPRNKSEAQPGLTYINTHVDPIDWRGTRGLAQPEALIAQTVSLLRDRREGRADETEPFGYLTHHLAHDSEIWEFSHQFISEICEGPVALYRHDRKEMA